METATVHMQATSNGQTAASLVFRPMQSQADADAFRTLNEEWISKLFRLEEKDRVTLGDPFGKIVAPGGRVYVALDGDTIVGATALVRYGDGIYELSKMAVSPASRGQGTGRRLLQYVLQEAAELGAHTVFLASSTKLQNAIHLYESLGFRHVPREELPPLAYERADVFMKIQVSAPGLHR